MERSLDTSGLRATETMNWWGGERAVLGWVLVATAGTQLCDTVDTNVQRFQLLPDDALCHAPAQFLHQKPHTAVLWERGVETHTLPLIDGPLCVDCGSETLAVVGTTFSFSAISWAVKCQGKMAVTRPGRHGFLGNLK